jgi:hypothetical protein
MSEFTKTWFIVPHRIIHLPKITLQLLKFYEKIFEFWNNGRECFLSNDSLAHHADMKSASTIKGAFKFFEDHGEMKRVFKDGKRYIIQPTRKVMFENNTDIKLKECEYPLAVARPPSRCSETPPLAVARHNNNNINNNNINIYTASDDAQNLHNRFDDFWKAYPRKQDKERAMRLWKRDRLDKIADKIISDVEKRKETEWKWRDKQYIKNPGTYLRGKPWDNDEILEDCPEQKSQLISIDDDLPSPDSVYHSIRRCYERNKDVHPIAYLMYQKICESFGGYQGFGRSNERDAKIFVKNNYNGICRDYMTNKSKSVDMMNSYFNK